MAQLPECMDDVTLAWLQAETAELEDLVLSQGLESIDFFRRQKDQG